MEFIQFLPYTYPKHFFNYRKKVELTCLIYSILCVSIYLFSLKNRLTIDNWCDLLYTFYTIISPLRYIYKPPKEEKKNPKIHIALLIFHIALISILSTIILSFIGLTPSSNNLFFLFTIFIWLFIYKLDFVLHQRFPTQMDRNGIQLPIQFPLLDLTGLFNRRERHEFEMIIQIDADGDMHQINRDQLEEAGIRVGGNDLNNEGDMEYIRNDTQNVHDSGVTATIQKSVSNLKKSTELKITVEETLTQLSNFIDNYKDTLIKEKAKKTLETIEKSNIPLISIGMTMMEVIQLFWNRIHATNFTEEQTNLLKENLIKELADGSTLSIKPVCSTGIVSRIIQSGIEIDNEIDIKPKWALRQELLQQSYQLWKEENKKLTKEELKAINSLQPTEEDVLVINNFKNNLQKKN